MLIVATVVRSLPGSLANLWIGTVVMGAAIAVGNVVVPELREAGLPTEVPLVTGLYSTVLGATAAVASGLALPIAEIGGWRLGIGIWVLLSVVAALVWPLRMRGQRRGRWTRRPAASGGTARTVTFGVARRRWPGRCRSIMATQGLTHLLRS